MAESSDVIAALQKLQHLPEEVHWFCPREGTDDHSFFFEEDLVGLQNHDHANATARVNKVNEAKARHVLVIEALQIFAFDGEDAEIPQKWMEERLAQQMQQCDICIREFHRGRRDLKQKLEGLYDPENVMEFLEKFDSVNLRRIEAGLSSATEQLFKLPAESRSIAGLDRHGVFALFEAFNCTPFYMDQSRLAQSFDKFFRLVQTNKLLKLSSYSPAMFVFLFGDNRDRALWATKALQKFKRNITTSEFEHCVRLPLQDAFLRVQLFSLEKEFLQQFWSGANLIVHRLDAGQIADQLRALETVVVEEQPSESDICRLALSHLQVDDDAFKEILAAIEHILHISAKDFWEALGVIAPSAWIDQVFLSPAFKRLLSPLPDGGSDPILLESLFRWIMPFLKSVSKTNQTATCRSLISHLMGRLQVDAMPEVKAYALNTGLKVLAMSLESINQDFWNVLLPTSMEALNIASQNLATISIAAKKNSTNVEDAAEVFKQAISLDCKCLVAFSKPPSSIRDQKDKFIQHLSIWNAASQSLDYGNTLLAKSLLSAVKSTSEIEAFVSKGKLSDDQTKVNDGLNKVQTILSGWLDRISEFTVEDLQKLFTDPETVGSLMIVLFSPNESIQLSLVEIIKSISGKSSRREAMGYLLQNHLTFVLNGISRALRTVEVAKKFTSSSSVLKPCSDIIDILCNPTDGLLRSQTLSKTAAMSVESFWRALWTFLTMVFSSTEGWSNVGHDRQILVEFCRRTMDFADNAFDQFGIIRGALSSSSSPESGEVEQLGKRLIERPKSSTAVIIKWLKLRDDFLVAKSCALVCKLLIRLKEFEVQLEEASLEYIMDIALDIQKNTLPQQAKAELLRALETHSGMTPDTHAVSSVLPAPTKHKQKTQVIDLEKWAGKAEKSSSRSATSTATSSASSKASTSVTPTYDKLQTSGLPFLSNKRAVQPKPEPAASSAFVKRRELELAEKKKRDALAIAQRRKQYEQSTPSANAGSALKNLGVAGKEHETPNKGPSMMVSSGDDSSDDDDDDEFNEMDEQLFGAKPAKQKGNALTAEQAKAMAQQRRGPVKKQRLVRSARDMRARLSPDLSPLHKTILGWEYFHDGVFPPNSNEEEYSVVLNTFRDASAYQRKFQPLLLLEAWNAFLKAKEENTSKPYEIKVAMRSTVDYFFEVSSTMSHEEGKDIAEGDIILLSKAQSPSTSRSDPHCLSRVNKISRKKTHMEIIYRTVPSSNLSPYIGHQSVLYGLKITSIIPLEREYGALLGLQYYDLCEEIARARPSPLLNYSEERLLPVMKNYDINKAQAKAVRCAIDNDAFTLVQGPPGSGKTKTIVAIVGALLSSSLKPGATMINQPKVQVQQSSNRPLPKKLLVCAPSNAAVDELVMRFKEGVTTMGGDHHPVTVVRIGRSDAINTAVQDVTLDELVNKKLTVGSNETNGRAQTQKIMEEHKVVSEKLRDARAKLDEAEAKGIPTKQLQDDFNALRRQKALLGQKVDDAKDNEGAQNRQAEFDKKKAQQDVLDSAHIICATLSGSGHDMFLNLNIEFETVIIDEAAQCVELSALIPLKYGCAKCVLVGDPQQLPPTIFSKDAARFKYEQSLFVRMQGNHPEDVHLLDTQYRMHPEISLFPSKAFYNERLLDGKDMALQRTRPWHSTGLLSPFRFFDVQGQHQSAPKGHSLINLAEVQVSIQLYKRLTKDFPGCIDSGKIGIITPYKSQLRELRDSFKRQFGPSIVDTVEFNTTDAFQGRESEVIIFSCVRASPAGGIGFLQDVRRMNVGLTRAKSSLWVLGNSQSLMRGEFWAKLVEDAKSRQLYTTGDIQALFSKPLAKVQGESGRTGWSTTSQDHSAMDIDEMPPKIERKPNEAKGNSKPNAAMPLHTEVMKKRRHSIDADEKRESSNKKRAAASATSSSSDSDVEMMDKLSSAGSSSSMSNGSNSYTTKTLNRKSSPLRVTNHPKHPPKPPAGPTGTPPVRPPPKKKEPDHFIKKKKKPGRP